LDMIFGAGSAAASLVLPLLGVTLMIVLAYFFTKWLAKKYQSMSLSGGKYMKIRERAVMGQDKQLVMVEIGDSIYVLGVAGNNIQTICRLDAAQFPEQKEPDKADFKKTFEDLLKKYGIRLNTAGGQDEKKD